MEKSYNKTSVVKWSVAVAVVLCAGIFITKTFILTKSTVDANEVEIKTPTSKTAIKMGASQNAVINALGKPKQIAAFSSQADYKQGTVLNYNGAKFYFVHGKLSNFEITSHKFNVGLASTHKYVAIGNTRSQLPRFKIQNRAALLDVTNDDSSTDQYLEYDLSDSGTVTKISYSDY